MDAELFGVSVLSEAQEPIFVAPEHAGVRPRPCKSDNFITPTCECAQFKPHNAGTL
ncbi:hypothetical protein OKW26_004910 [Paraburkholderia sp. 32]